MLNLVLILGMVLNLAAGFLFIGKFEPIVWGKRGFFVSGQKRIRDPACQEWDGWQG